MRLQHAVGDTIRKLRVKQGVTLTALAKRGYISQGYLSQIEHGQKSMTNDMFETVASALGLSTAGLMKEIYEYLEEVN